jgi:hypothetical protein
MSKPVQLVADLDDPAGVDQEVGRVGDAARQQPVGGAAVALAGQLVVGAAADDAGPQRIDGLVVERGPERVGAEHVDVLAHQVLEVVDGPHPGVHAQQRPHGIRVDVGDHDLGAVLEEVVGEPPPHLADAGDGDPAPGEGRLAPHVLGGRAHPLEDPVGRQHRGVAGAPTLRERPVAQRVDSPTTSMSGT